MDSPLFATPVARQGPTSRLLRRRSEKAPAVFGLERMDEATPIVQRTPANVSFAVPVSSRSFRPDQTLVGTGPDETIGWEATRFVDRNMSTFIDNELTINQTMRIGDAYPLLQSSENLFVDFLSTISAESVGLEALDQVAELEELVSAHVNALRGHKGSNALVKNITGNLSNEKNTWRMIGKLYHDRLFNRDEAMETESDNYSAIVMQTSEKRMVDRLFARERDLRQAQAVIDWLEQNARDNVEENIQLEYFTEATVSWENTLAVLNKTSRSSGRSMVTSMDPDAPRRERLALHDLDAQDESRLVKSLFILIRSGQLDKAQQLCVKVGQAWKAATLEGWKLYHDPNYERDMGDEKLPVEGNRNRDIWKAAVWKMTQDESIPPFERAIYSTFCGNIGQLLSVCKTWEDYLWAYTKVMVDLCVETEIRELSPKVFVSLPKEYWDNKKTTEAIFQAIAAANDPVVKTEQHLPYHVVQRCFITQNFDELFTKMDDWLEVDEYRNNPHLLRFLCHIVLVLRKLETRPDITSDDKGTSVLRAYASYLMQTNRAQQVAWYVSQLPQDDQIEMYAEFLETVNAESDRRLALTLAIESGLPISAIKSRVVQNILSLELSDDDGEGKEEWLDKRKIDSISWLLYDKQQRSEAMYQANALTRSLVASGKYDLAKDAWSKLPDDSVQIVSVLSSEMNDGVLGAKDANTINEYLCWKAYFRAKDSFGDWFDHYHREKPKPVNLPENPSFTEKVAYEQRTKQYQRDLERWQGAQALQAGDACANLNDVITFSGGWLVDQIPQDDPDVQRERETDYLRRLCIPELVLLLHSILHSTEQYDKAIALADIVASEQYTLYEVYHQDNMRELLSKIRQSCLKSMEIGNRDALGWILTEEKSE